MTRVGFVNLLSKRKRSTLLFLTLTLTLVRILSALRRDIFRMDYGRIFGCGFAPLIFTFLVNRSALGALRQVDIEVRYTDRVI